MAFFGKILSWNTSARQALDLFIKEVENQTHTFTGSEQEDTSFM